MLIVGGLCGRCRDGGSLCEGATSLGEVNSQTSALRRGAALRLSSRVLGPTGVREPRASLGGVGICFAARFSAGGGPPAGRVSGGFTHFGAATLRSRNGTTTVAGDGSLAREGDGTIGVGGRYPREISHGKKQNERQLSLGAAGVEGKAHEASVWQAGKKTYGAERLGTRATQGLEGALRR